MTSYRFVCVGDLHLIAGPKNADRLAALDHVIADAPTRGPVDAWFWPGDLTHVGMTIELRNLLVDRAQAMSKIAPVVVVPGNHDPDGDLDFLAKLRGHIEVVRKPEVIDLNPASNRTREPMALFCLPYPSKAQLVAAGTPHDQINAAVDRAMDVIFMQAGAALDDARQAGRLTGAIGHVNIGGAVSSVGQPQIGTELEITAQHLARLGDCFKVFNHIHKHQRVADAVYPGSLCRLDWGETEPKGYVVVDCDLVGNTGTLVRDGEWRHRETFVEIPTPRMCHVEMEIGRADGMTGARFTKGALSDDYAGADVRVRVSYQQAERDLVWPEIQSLPTLFVGARRVVVEPIAIQQRELRAPEVVQAGDVDSKLRAYGRLMNVSWTDAIEEAVQRLLLTEDGDAVVNEVSARLGPLAELEDVCATK